MQTETTLVDYSPRKRHRSDDQESSNDEVSVKKRNTQRWYYVLESESSNLDNSCDDVETIYSLQEKSTDYVQDTPDTDSEPRMIEFEVASTSSLSDVDKNQLGGFSDSSEPQDRWVDPVQVASSCNSIIEDESSCDSQCGPSLSTLAKHICCECGVKKTSHPLFTVCDNCFKVRKQFFPPRTRKRRRCRNAHSKYGSSQETRLSELCKSTPESQETVIPESLSSVSCNEESLAVKSSQASLSQSSNDLLLGYCKLCYTMPRNSGFSHNRIVHVIGCYECSVKIWKTIGRCPICNRKIENVSKIIIL